MDNIHNHRTHQEPETHGVSTTEVVHPGFRHRPEMTLGFQG